MLYSRKKQSAFYFIWYVHVKHDCVIYYYGYCEPLNYVLYAVIFLHFHDLRNIVVVGLHASCYSCMHILQLYNYA